MGRLSIIPFVPEHLLRLTPRRFDAREIELAGNFLARAREYQQRGVAYTGVVDGEIMACAGLLPLWRGVAEMWMVTTELVNRYPLAFQKAVKNGLEILVKAMGLWRLQTAIHEEHRVSQKWIQSLGFSPEGDKPHYGPDGATYRGYARIFPAQLEKGA